MVFRLKICSSSEYINNFNPFHLKYIKDFIFWNLITDKLCYRVTYSFFTQIIYGIIIRSINLKLLDIIWFDENFRSEVVWDVTSCIFWLRRHELVVCKEKIWNQNKKNWQYFKFSIEFTSWVIAPFIFSYFIIMECENIFCVFLWFVLFTKSRHLDDIVRKRLK